MHTIHNVKYVTEESFEVVKNILGFKKINDYYKLGWKAFLNSQKIKSQE